MNRQLGIPIRLAQLLPRATTHANMASSIAVDLTSAVRQSHGIDFVPIDS